MPNSVIRDIKIQSSSGYDIRDIGAKAENVVLTNGDDVESTIIQLDIDKLSASKLGVANGIAELDANGKVPSSQLPSYVDDVIEGYYNETDGKFYKESTYTTEIIGESDKIYISIDTNKTYRWSGSIFVTIASDLALGETSSTAYRGDRGKIAYDHASDSAKISSAVTSGLYKIAGTADGHIASLTAVIKSDITALGIPESDTTYTITSGSVGSASLGTAIDADDITAWDAGSITNAAFDDTTHSLNITLGAVPSLTYSAKSIPNVSVTSTTVVTAVTENT